MMRLFFLVLPLLLFTACTTPAPREGSFSYKGILAGINAPQTLQVMGETYSVGYSYSAPDANQALVEYFRPGETPKSWTRLLGLRVYLDSQGAFEQAKAQEQQVRGRGVKSVLMYKDRVNGGHGVEFILLGKGYLELNVWRYLDRPDGNGTTSLQYAEVIPSATLATMDKPQAVAYLKDRRAKAVKAMELTPMPAIELAQTPNW